jgi:hypothetical protein
MAPLHRVLRAGLKSENKYEIKSPHHQVWLSCLQGPSDFSLRNLVMLQG